MTWMLTGGAGYIGAHIARAFRAIDLPVVVLDDLSTGIAENVPDGVPLVTASVQDREAVRSAIREHEVTGLLHLAAKKAVGESVERPLLYWDENLAGMVSLLQVCVEGGVDRVLFSSSAAVFGTPPVEFVTEETPTAPLSPYGETKLVGEWVLRDLAVANPGLLQQLVDAHPLEPVVDVAQRLCGGDVVQRHDAFDVARSVDALQNGAAPVRHAFEVLRDVESGVLLERYQQRGLRKMRAGSSCHEPAT